MPVSKKRNVSSMKSTEKKITVLILEDHSINLKLENIALLKAGFNVKTADNLERMKTILTHEKIDVVIMDYFFQKLKGIQEIKHLKQNNHNPNLRIIVWSIEHQNEIMDQAYFLGCDLYLVKPLPRPKLIQEIKKVAKVNYRKAERSPCKIGFILKNEDKIYKTIAIDISATGCHLLDLNKEINVSLEQVIICEFILPNTASLITCKGKVVRITEEGFGIKFLTLNEPDQQKITHFVNSNSLSIKSEHYYL
ncbi:response regulator [Spirobacillus cienkowskii]|uniref:response regulator n=1 Tax=Spirobacillus cienkowskii TaxID=495820 RepID=UPI0030CB4431